eukprot:CAMPEP_0184978462 /NCGR_PEP_ID=MMETSP1098-20130426/8931_1 /TAXON_ID=89044 /ORGANISM="Spumella elongata, Strain CCAP 955/1" /LENGTH=122 /DNA_ID=CAMNT_0027501595 /DNA_START=181 /DNA_END=549 /DNA_ORIENTATION=-
MEEGNIANQGEAEKCRDIAKAFLSKGEYAKASKFFEKSLRLFPLAGVKALKEKADRLAAEPPPSSSSHQKPTSSHSHSHSSSGGGSNSNGNADSGATTPTGGSSRSYTPEQEQQQTKNIIAI